MNALMHVKQTDATVLILFVLNCVGFLSRPQAQAAEWRRISGKTDDAFEAYQNVPTR
jgi:hypothetical protein